MKVTKLQQQAGFTLIELIMVIVILGVLSAFALPRFADLGGDARAASIKGAAGAMKSAANIAHAQWLADGSPSTAPITVTLEGTSIPMNSSGYPTSPGIITAAQIANTDYTFTAPAAADASVTLTISGGTAATCYATYTAASGAVTSDASGC